MEQSLIICFGLGLFRYIFDATPEKRWLWLHLRWRLVSRRFNRYILFSHGDRFHHTMLRLHSDLEWADCRYGPTGNLNGHFYFPIPLSDGMLPDYHTCITPLHLISLLCQSRTFDDVHVARMRMSPEYYICFDGIRAEISEIRLAKEVLFWFQAVPRVGEGLPVKPAEMDRDKWIGACLILNYKNRRNSFDSRFDDLCVQCWKLTMQGKRKYVDGDQGLVYICDPCNHYISRCTHRADFTVPSHRRYTLALAGLSHV